MKKTANKKSIMSERDYWLALAVDARRRPEWYKNNYLNGALWGIAWIEENLPGYWSDYVGAFRQTWYEIKRHAYAELTGSPVKPVKKNDTGPLVVSGAISPYDS